MRGDGPRWTLHTVRGQDPGFVSRSQSQQRWQALGTETFFVLPHPAVAGYYAQRAEHPDAWLAGMQRLQAKLDARPADGASA